MLPKHIREILQAAAGCHVQEVALRLPDNTKVSFQMMPPGVKEAEGCAGEAARLIAGLLERFRGPGAVFVPSTTMAAIWRDCVGFSPSVKRVTMLLRELKIPGVQYGRTARNAGYWLTEEFFKSHA